MKKADSRLSWDQADDRAAISVLSTSGPRLPGLVVKRTIVERSIDMAPSPQDTHVVCVHNSGASKSALRVKTKGSRV